MHAIGFYVSPCFQMLDLAGPAGAFEAANDELGSPAYRIHILAADAGAVTNSLGIATAAASLDDAVLDTLVVIGGPIEPHLSAGALSRIVDASNRCRRVASVCTGAFTLAAAGLLDGRLSIDPGRGGSHLLPGRKHMDFGGHYRRNRSLLGFDRGGPWFRHRQGRRTAPCRLPSSPWRTITARETGADR